MMKLLVEVLKSSHLDHLTRVLNFRTLVIFRVPYFH